MAIKPKKTQSLSKKKNNQKQKDPNKFHLGRNTGTYLIILGTILAVVLLAVLFSVTLFGENSYLKTYQNNKAHPYSEVEDSSNVKYNYPNAIFMEKDDFDLLDVKFYCKKIDSKDAHSAEFSLNISKNDKTPNVVPIDNTLQPTANQTYLAYTGVCLSANWVDFQKYSTLKGITKTNFNKTLSEKTSADATITVSLGTDNVFPLKANTWPYKVKVSHPEAYLMISIITPENGVNKVKTYVIHYSFDQYYVPGTTSPAI